MMTRVSSIDGRFDTDVRKDAIDMRKKIENLFQESISQTDSKMSFLQRLLSILPTVDETVNNNDANVVGTPDEPRERNLDDVVCKVCDAGDNEEQLLLCDGCETACHAGCIGLSAVPQGDWFCAKCVKHGKKAKVIVPTPKTRIYIYLRVSSQGQNQPEYGRVGIQTQLEAIYEYMRRMGLTLYASYSDVGSARATANLPNYQKMLAETRRHPGCVLVYSVSRFSRCFAEGVSTLNALHAQDSYVFSVSENISSYDPQFARLLRQSQDLSEQLSATMKASVVRRRNQGQLIATGAVWVRALS